MARDDAQKNSIVHTLGAALAGVLATKLAAYTVTTVWRLVTREDPPQLDQPAGAGKKAAWIGLIGAATGAARQAARDVVKPPSAPPG